MIDPKVILARKKITKLAVNAAKDLLQVINYTDSGRIKNAIYNMEQAISRQQKLLRGLKKL